MSIAATAIPPASPTPPRPFHRLIQLPHSHVLYLPINLYPNNLAPCPLLPQLLLLLLPHFSNCFTTSASSLIPICSLSQSASEFMTLPQPDCRLSLSCCHSKTSLTALLPQPPSSFSSVASSNQPLSFMTLPHAHCRLSFLCCICTTSLTSPLPQPAASLPSVASSNQPLSF